jgi:hypothetical protein
MHPIARIIDRTFASTVILLLSASACIEEDQSEPDFRVLPGDDEAEPQDDPEDEEGGEQPECPRDPGPSPASSSDKIRLPLHEPGSSRKLITEPECP